MSWQRTCDRRLRCGAGRKIISAEGGNGHKARFHTYVETVPYKIFIDGGLASNYGGEGGRAFKSFLLGVGIPEEEVSFVTRYNGEEIAVIEIVL
ncbi:hypothetical protein [Bacillus velezensis]|uniref:hypothetical protein n=1 Tax=Bacillus velezensis TaxID=492670 RepID=UPI003364D657